MDVNHECPQRNTLVRSIHTESIFDTYSLIKKIESLTATVETRY